MVQTGQLFEPARGAREPGAATTGAAAVSVRPRLVVVGNGMVAHHFCQTAASKGLLEQYQIIVYGEEPHPAYDRINLGLLLSGGTLRELALEPPTEDRPAAIPTHLGTRVVALDRGARQVELSTGERQSYAKLVIATGAQAVLPNLPGANLPGVAVYRSASDASELRREALSAASNGQRVVVAGAGLLGLELADQLRDLGLEADVVESGARLLPRQLDAPAAAILRAALEGEKLHFHLERRVASVEPGTAARLLVRLSDGTVLHAGLVIFAIGVRPRDELARVAGLACDLFGGVEINDRLQTSDPDIFAIGDCARCAGMSYGLVAPGYAMADALVDGLLGNDVRFASIEPAIRLKTKSVEVSAMGESALEGGALRAVVYRTERVYRRLSVRDGRIVGASAIGAWGELVQAQQAVARRQRLRRDQERRFKSNRSVWPSETLSLEHWPDATPVCSCTGATAGALKRAFGEGHRTPEALLRSTGVGSVCGSCRPLVESLVTSGRLAASPNADSKLAVTSFAAAVLVVAWFTVPPIPYAASSAGAAYDGSWRDPLLKQITGYGLVSLLGAGSVFSLRKRAGWFSWATFRSWRVFHSIASVAALSLAILHTGFRLGSNFNAALMLTFLASAMCGAVAAFAAVFERALPLGVGSRVRRGANRAHLYAAWPLPMLITFHVLKFYYF